MEVLLNDENGGALQLDTQWLNKKEKTQSNYATLSNISYTENTPTKSTTKNKQTKGSICELPNVAIMPRLGEAWDPHTQQVEVRNQL